MYKFNRIQTASFTNQDSTCAKQNRPENSPSLLQELPLEAELEVQTETVVNR